MKLRRLKRLKLNRVDLVPRGANPEAHIVLAKNDPSDRDSNVTDQKMTPKEPAVADKTVEKTAEELAAELAAANERLAKVEAERDEAAQKVEKIEAEATEAEKVQKALDETKAELAEVKKAQREREFIAKADKFKNIGSAERVGKLLEAADRYFEDAEKELLDKILSGASEAVEKGALFAQLSENGSDIPATWEERLDKAAAERVAKSDGSLTKEQAKLQIMREDSDLRSEYLAERG